MNERKTKIQIRKEEETVMVECPRCKGTGLFAGADWHSPSIPCDDCMGSGEVEEEMKS